MSLISGKQLQTPLSVTGSLFGTSSYALTASYALNGGGGGSNIDTSSFATTGSNTFVGVQTITGSNGVLRYSGTDANTGNPGYPSLAEIHANDAQPWLERFYNDTFSSSSAIMAYFGWDDGRFVFHNESTQSIGIQVNSYDGTTGLLVYEDKVAFVNNIEVTGSINAPNITGSLEGTASWATNFVSASNYVLNNQTSSFVLNSQTSSMTVATASYVPNYLTTGSSNISQTISGSLIIDQNLTVLGSSSIQYITSSQLNIGTNLITVNTATPAVRFGGLAVYDSGSTGTGLTGSILWDSQNDVWVYSNPSGAAYDGAMILVGPRNSSGLGSEVGINQWYATIGNGSHHMTSSQIYNSGSLIRLETNTQVTGTLNVSQGITGSLFGTASWATNALTASYVVNAISSSYAATASYVVNALTASYVLQAVSTSYSQTASYVNPLYQDVIITGSLTVSGSQVPFQIVSASTSIIHVSSSGGVGIGKINSTPSVMLDVDGNIRSGGQLSGAQVRTNYILSNTQNLQFSSGSVNNPTTTVAATMFTGSGNWVYQAAQGATDLGYRVAINGPGISGSLYVSGSTVMSGSLNVIQGITGSLFGTSSWAQNSVTASYALTAGGGGISQGKVVAIVSGYANLF